jgi:hypothetical protein
MATYQLFRGTELLGTIEHTTDDFPWHAGTFKPAPAFVASQELFARELALLDGVGTEEGVAAWEAVRAEITSPGIRLVENGGGRSFKQPLIHICESEVWWR